MMRNKDIQLSCIYSLPRSGSTVLSAELDRFEGVVCVPESYFPQIIDYLSSEELDSPKVLARILLETCDGGFLLSQSELEEAILPGNWRDTFIRIGLRCAEKTKRNPDDISAIVWKSTRMLTAYKPMLEAGSKFIILRRNPVNVYDSQFRVDFGVHNRNVIRFAAFRQSYEALFSRLKTSSAFELEYETIPNKIEALARWVGGSGRARTSGVSTMEQTMAQQEWHKGLLDGFESTDELKRKNISLFKRLILHSASSLFFLSRPYLFHLREKYDRQLAAKILERAVDGVNSEKQ